MKIENRQQVLIVVTVAVLGLLVCDSLVFEPLAGWYSTRAKQIAELHAHFRGAVLVKMQRRRAGTHVGPVIFAREGIHRILPQKTLFGGQRHRRPRRFAKGNLVEAHGTIHVK